MTYDVTIDGKAAGTYVMSIWEGKDGKASMTGVANVSVTFYLVKTYRYTYTGTEFWKDNRLQSRGRRR